MDGEFGEKTDAAVKDFQARMGLKTDGVVGPITSEVLRAAPAKLEAEELEDESPDGPLGELAAIVGDGRLAMAPADGEPDAPRAEALWKGVGVGTMAASADVRALQGDLTRSGFETEQDGRFGPDTERQLKRFQRKFGLKADGIAAEKTFRTLRRANQKSELREDAPQGFLLGDRVREASDTLALGRFGVVVAEGVADDGAYIYDVVWADGSLSEGVRQFRLRNVDARLLEEANAGWLKLIAKLVAAGLTEEQAQAVLAKGMNGGGLSAPKKRGASRVPEMKRLPNGTFAPKGRGKVLQPGDAVLVPHKSGKGQVAGVVTGEGKVTLMNGPDEGTDIDLQPLKQSPGTEGHADSVQAALDAFQKAKSEGKSAKELRDLARAVRKAKLAAQKAAKATPGKEDDKAAAAIPVPKEAGAPSAPAKPTGVAGKAMGTPIKTAFPPNKEGAKAEAAYKAAGKPLPEPKHWKGAEAENFKADVPDAAAGKGAALPPKPTPTAAADLTWKKGDVFSVWGDYALADGTKLSALEDHPTPGAGGTFARPDGETVEIGPSLGLVPVEAEPTAAKSPNAQALKKGEPLPGEAKAEDAAPEAKQDIDQPGAPTKTGYKSPDGDVEIISDAMRKAFGEGEVETIATGGGIDATLVKSGSAKGVDELLLTPSPDQNGTVDIGGYQDGEQAWWHTAESPEAAQAFLEQVRSGAEVSVGEDGGATLNADAPEAAPAAPKAGKEHKLESHSPKGLSAKLKKLSYGDTATLPNGTKIEHLDSSMPWKVTWPDGSETTVASNYVAAQWAMEKDTSPLGAAASGKPGAAPAEPPSPEALSTKLEDAADQLEAAGRGSEADVLRAYIPDLVKAKGDQLGQIDSIVNKLLSTLPKEAKNSKTAGAKDATAAASSPSGGGGLSPNQQNLSLKDMPLGTTFAMNDGSEWVLHKPTGGQFFIAKPAGGGKAKPFHMMMAPPKVGPVAEGYEGGAPASASSQAPVATPPDDLFDKLSSSVDIAQKAKSEGKKPAFAPQDTLASTPTKPTQQAEPTGPVSEPVSAALQAYLNAGGEDPAIIDALSTPSPVAAGASASAAAAVSPEDAEAKGKAGKAAGAPKSKLAAAQGKPKVESYDPKTGPSAEQKAANAAVMKGGPAPADLPAVGASLTMKNGSQYKVTSVDGGKVYAIQLLDGNPEPPAVPISMDAVAAMDAPSGAAEPEAFKPSKADRQYASGKIPTEKYASGKSDEEILAMADVLDGQAALALGDFDEQNDLAMGSPVIKAGQRWKKLAQELRDFVAAENAEANLAKAETADAPAAGSVQPQLAGSPGRGPTGKLRNFKAMGAEKLQGVIAELTSFGGDPEALAAAKAALTAKQQA